MIVSIVGDVDHSQANEIAQTLLKIDSSVRPAYCEVAGTAVFPASLFYSKLEALAQREIQILFDSQQGHAITSMAAVARNNPDYFPLLVGNTFLVVWFCIAFDI